MIDRVGSLSASQTLIGEYSRIQARTLLTQTQIATGKVGDQFADVKDKAGVLVAAKLKAGEVESYTATTKEVLNRIDLQDVHLRELSDISARLRAAIGDALSTGHAPAMMHEVKNIFDEAVAILNTRVDGKYLYGGSRSDQPPVNVSDLAGLMAAPTVADIFDNTNLKQTQRIDDHETIEVGMTASDIGTGLMQMIKDIAAFDAGVSGPIAVDLTPAQTAFLSAQHVAVPGVQDGINALAAVNGIKHAQTTAAAERHEGMAAYFTKFIGDIEDVDLAEAVARLNQDQVAAQAAGRMIAQLNQMSLLEYL